MPRKSRAVQVGNTLENVIELFQVTKRYGRKAALQDLSLNIPPGITGLLGPNGSGKSSLIKALLGLVRVQSGSLSVLGHRLPDDVRIIRDLVGYMPEDDCHISGLTGIESIHFMGQLSGLPKRECLRRAHEILDFSDIGQERYRAVETYSTGMRQKLKFAQTLVHDPQLLIFDEPTTGLDPGQRVAMLQRIETLARKHGKSILLSTHILPDVKDICDWIVILAEGRVKAADRLSNLLRPVTPGMRLRVLENHEQLKLELKAMGWDVQLQDDGMLWVAGVTDEDCQAIWRAADKTNVSILSLEPASNSLEQIFFNIVHETKHAAA